MHQHFDIKYGRIRRRNRNLQTSKRHFKAKRRAPAYSRTLRQIRGIVQRLVQVKFGSDSQMVIGDRVAIYGG